MKKNTTILILFLSFLVSSTLIHEKKYFQIWKSGKRQISEEYYKSLEEKYRLPIEKEYNYTMGGIISASLGLLLIGYNNFKKK